MKKERNEIFQRMKLVKDLRRFTHPVVNSHNKAMFLQSNNEVRSRNHCCIGKAISITYSECVYLSSCLIYPAYKSHLLCAAILSPSVACPALPIFFRIIS
jgi:hypothetical protein